MKFLMFQLYLNWRSESRGVTISKFSKLSLILLQREFSSESLLSNKSLLLTRGLLEFLSEDFLLDVGCLLCLHGDVKDWRSVLTPAMVFLTVKYDTSSLLDVWWLTEVLDTGVSVQYTSTVLYSTLYITLLLLFSTGLTVDKVHQYCTHHHHLQSCTNSNFEQNDHLITVIISICCSLSVSNTIFPWITR